ncbi:23S rRNA (adenine(2030)-N(6))-methyltransferase RlmJ [Pseudooceanicola sp.]|uniref:23S rRNA (adenine(2030)-N(6))-methyltransferase RlmJ n=1 Tax=Pseudooceanicola sp. TaxID=1914328 RepID=UPI0035C6FA97
MLSYQHSYHAGNPADIHKHAILAWMLDRLSQKPKPLSYLETHAGRAVYDLSSAEALKTGEAAAGVGRMLGKFAPDHPYRKAVEALRAEAGSTAYPGSPWIAAHLLRADDQLHLAELHPQEHEALRVAMRGRARVHRADGLELAMSLCPPEPRRGVLVIDPSYEIKTEYEALPPFIGKLHRAWNVGVIALWYPILKDGRHRGMLRGLEALQLPRVVRSEVSFPPVREGHGMVGSGLYVVNAPFGLAEEAERIAGMFAE